MHISSDDHAPYGRPPRRTGRLTRALITFGRAHPVLAILGIAVLSNVTGSIFNIVYNYFFIILRWLDPGQKAVFENVALPLYNVLAYPAGMGVSFLLLRPLLRHHAAVLRGDAVAPEALHDCRRLLVNAPLYLICTNSLCWLPGAILFPALITGLAGTNNAWEIWSQFIASFIVAAGLTVVQTFFLLEEFLIRVLYPIYFKDMHPADIKDGRHIPFGWRLLMLWGAVAFMPLFAVVVVAGNVAATDHRLHLVLILTVLGGLISGGFISYLVGHGLLRWLWQHRRATDLIAQGLLAARVGEKRPDEWGSLSDHFNEMAAGLEQAALMRETFGQIVHPKVRDAIMKRYPGIGGDVQEITVLFADIRGFTRRSAGEPPEKVVALLNRFLTLAVACVEEQGGLVNKFLGDGVMALFGTPQAHADHADLAVDAALKILDRLQELNGYLRGHGEEPLLVGIGIHTGLALTGCIGATLVLDNGKTALRREFTAIGETVNLSQRLEQLTKTLGGPTLISEQTRERLTRPVPMRDLGVQPIPGYTGTLRVYQVGLGDGVRVGRET